jgi:hypothetical protein
MNKKFGISSAILIVILIAALPAGCKSGGQKPAEDEITAVDVQDERAIEDIRQAERIFNALPSPLESAMLIKSAGARFSQSQMNPVNNANSYVTRKSMALNLGIYTCDLSFASLYEQTQLIIDYMNAARKMADGLGILNAVDRETIDRLEENINNSETIIEIVSETFLNSNSYLQENGQPAIAAMVLVGGWFEGLYISTQLVDMKEFSGNKLVARIIDQKHSLDLLIRLLEGSRGNPAIDEIFSQVNTLKTVFDKISIESTPVTAEFDKASNSTELKSQVRTNMSEEVFMELTKTVAEIRNSFVTI